MKRGRLANFDFNTIVKIQDRISTKYDFIFSNITLLGSLEITALLLIIVLIIRKKLGGILVFFLFLFGNFADLFGKAYLEHPGPPIHFLREHAPSFLPQWYSHPVSSYPSGHSLRTVFLFVILGFSILNFKKLNKTARILGVMCIGTIAVLTILSRVSLGKHWPSDVFGGGLLGGSLGFLSLLFL
ncbi:MAG: phosphatase PAP2 family protein [bacterium]|nr:phosphatase PAP2 family protein [bacterium]